MAFFVRGPEVQHVCAERLGEKSRKMNAYVERFNRTAQEEFIMYYRSLLRDNIERCNEDLTEWLQWYNEERPHEALGFLSLMEYHRAHYEQG